MPVWWSFDQFEEAYCFCVYCTICWTDDYDEWIKFCLNQKEQLISKDTWLQTARLEQMWGSLTVHLLLKCSPPGHWTLCRTTATAASCLTCLDNLMSDGWMVGYRLGRLSGRQLEGRDKSKRGQSQRYKVLRLAPWPWKNDENKSGLFALFQKKKKKKKKRWKNSEIVWSEPARGWEEAGLGWSALASDQLKESSRCRGDDWLLKSSLGLTRVGLGLTRGGGLTRDGLGVSTGSLGLRLRCGVCGWRERVSVSRIASDWRETNSGGLESLPHDKSHSREGEGQSLSDRWRLQDEVLSRADENASLSRGGDPSGSLTYPEDWEAGLAWRGDMGDRNAEWE